MHHAKHWTSSPLSSMQVMYTVQIKRVPIGCVHSKTEN
jgi:hypothetical protein